MTNSCEYCMYYEYDEEYEEYECQVAMDEDDYERLISQERTACPYFRSGDEYQIVKKQM